jgi:hypothetical protein
MTDPTIQEVECDLGWTTQVDEDRELQGFKLLDSPSIVCPECNTYLLEILKVQSTDYESRIQVVCPKCEEESFITKIQGKIYIAPAPNIQLLDIKIDKNTYKVKVIQNEQ